MDDMSIKPSNLTPTTKFIAVTQPQISTYHYKK